MFKIDPKVYSSMFSMPTEIADKGLKFASGEQLKVIICIFRNPNITIEEINKKTGVSLAAVKECIEYWENEGILTPEKEEKTVKTEKQGDGNLTEKVIAPLPDIHYVNPTQAEIEKIIKKNGSMKRLFNEAQEILGKTLGYTMQCTIYSVVNFYGITPDVVNYMLHFAKSIDAVSQDDIQKIAKYWAQNGITTLAAADDYIAETEKAIILFRELAEQTNNDEKAPSFAVLEMMCQWLRWGFKIDAVEKAFNIMKEEKQTGRLVWKNMCHINGTLKKWRTSGTFTVEEIEKGTKKFETKKSKTDAEPKETSFSVELAEKQAKRNRADFGEKKNKKRTRGKGA